MVGSDFIELLAEPVNKLLNKKNDKILSKLWNEYFLELYNNRSEFIHDLYQSNSKITKTILNNTFYDNYNFCKIKLNQIKRECNPWEDLDESRVLTLIKPEKATRRNSTSTLQQASAGEKIHKNDIEKAVISLVVSMFQYLSYYEENNIDVNLWNYCLNSLTFSYEFFFIGLITVICQYIWFTLLVYNVFSKFKVSHSADIILVAIISTIISLIYSYKSLKSYYHTRKLYKFRIKLYKDFPLLQLTKTERKKLFFEKRKITMKKKHIIYNWWVDFFSNCVLPIFIPLINVFIILGTETCLDAVLNCIAVFFIIQIDEDLYSLNSWELERKTIETIKWTIGCIYCQHFPSFKDSFRNEFENWHHTILRMSSKFKRNKVEPGFID